LPTSSNKRKIQRTRRFGRDVRRLPNNVQKEAFQTATQLAENSSDPTLNIKSLTGFRGIY
jgi:threonine dehydratase